MGRTYLGIAESMIVECLIGSERLFINEPHYDWTKPAAWLSKIVGVFIL